MIRNWLKTASPLWFNTYALVAAFGVYFCMYAFRKPFTAAEYGNKELLVIAQVIGYMLSKFWGIRLVPALKGQNRAFIILGLIAFAELMLIFFAFLPPALRAYDWIFLFSNGLPLGIIWGVVFSYLEGRKFTEILAAGLTISFIISSGFVKSVGKSLELNWSVSAYEMPYLAGLIFFPFLGLFVFMLAQIPPPGEEDVALRTIRPPMNRKDRRQFFRRFALGFILLTLAYMLITAFRDVRESFANEIWLALGINEPSIFTATELPIGLFIGIILALCFKIKDNALAYRFYHYLILSGLALILAATVAFRFEWISPIAWMVMVGMGGYMAYVTFASVMFDRIIAAFKHPANAGFMIYVVDAFGYLGSVMIIFYKGYSSPDVNWLDFFITISYVIVLVGGTLTAFSLFYFDRKYWHFQKQQHP